MSAFDSSPSRDPVERLAESFLERYRRGERPSLTEYIERHPELADDIRDLFPALVEMEGLKTGPSGALSQFGPGPPGPPLARARLGDYHIVREIGRGAMGIVYEAVQESLTRPVALKILPPRSLPDHPSRKRFEREARSAARLHHTNIVPVFDFGEHNGVCYYAMQLIGGQPLDRVLVDIIRLRKASATRSWECPTVTASETGPDPDGSDAEMVRTISQSLVTGRFTMLTAAVLGPEAPSSSPAADPGAPGATPRGDDFLLMPAPADAPGPNGTDPSSLAGRPQDGYCREIARLGVQAADALAYAHRRGVWHRDIKPSNLLLDPLGNLWITDFGLARVDDGENLSHPHDILGTLRYMSPERFRGVSSVRCDVYALGATLYEMLALRPAFDARDRLELIHQIATQAPTPLRQIDRRIPRDLEVIVLKCLAKDPADRFATAAELRDELRRFVEGRPIRSRPVPFYERYWRWCKRNPGLATANAAAASLTIALAIGSTVAARVYRAQRDEIGTSLERVERAETQGRERLFEALTERARAGRFGRRIGQRFDSLASLAEAARIGRELELPPERLAPLRDEAIAALALPDMKPDGRPISCSSADVLRWAIDPGITRYAFRYRSGEIVVRRTSDDRELARFRGRGDREIFIFVFSPDGRYLASGHFPDLGVTVWDVDRGTAVVEDPGPVGGFAAEFTPDGRRLLLARDDGRAFLYNLATGRVDRRWSAPAHVAGFAFAPDGTRVAAWTHVADRPSCLIAEVETGRVLLTIPLPGAADHRVAWSPDASMLATPCGDSVYLWDAATGARRRVLKAGIFGGQVVGFHPAGTLLACNGYEGRLRFWEPQLGRPVLDLTGYWGGRIHSDGRVIIQGEADLTPYRVNPALEYRTQAHPFDQITPYREPVVHPGGRLLAVGSDGGLMLWDLARGTELGLLPIGRVYGVSFAAAGDLITSGNLGVCRWPVRIDDPTGAVRVGPPVTLPFAPHTPTRHSTDGSGRVVALPWFSVVKVHTPAGDRRITGLDDCRYTAVSPDGRWLATGGHSGSGVRVWRLSDGQKVADLRRGFGASVAFSPDGRWLMVNGGPCGLWEVGTWAEARTVGGVGFSFTPDGRALVVQDQSKALRLVECATGRTLARFEAPEPFTVYAATFSPDGARLVVTTQDGPAVHVWDLRSVRKHLAGMSLDWDAPPLPDADAAPLGAAPLRLAGVHYGPFSAHMLLDSEAPAPLVERLTSRLRDRSDDAEAYHVRGHAFRRLLRHADAVDDFTRALRLRPGDAHLLYSRGWSFRRLDRLDAALSDYEAAAAADPAFAATEPEYAPELAGLCNELAWRLVTGPPADRDPPRAVTLARRAVDLAPGESAHVNTLGVALYRAGRYEEAVATLDRNLATARKEWDAHDLFFRAMARHRLGQTEAALVDFARAVRWVEAHKNLPPHSLAELKDIRAEAEAVLAGPASELPRDVFAR